jgi:S-adenosylmethionine synthetase
MGRTPEIKTIRLQDGSGNVIEREIETFTWEKLDYVDKVKEAFGL